jgi:single-stranded DNA-binding protein
VAPDPLDAVVVGRDQAEHAAELLAKDSRIVVPGKLQQRSWTAEDGSARSTVEVVAEELGASPGPRQSRALSQMSLAAQELSARFDIAHRRSVVPMSVIGAPVRA